jgi:hypothetical protein
MPGRHQPALSGTQLIAGAAATMTATVAASYFGVAGTLIGAGAVSVLSTAGTTLCQHFLDRGKEQIAGRVPRSPAARIGARAARRSWPRWYILAGTPAGLFLAVMGIVTAFELATGRPLSDTVHGEAGRGTSVTGARPRHEPPARGEATPPAPITPSTSPGRTPRTTPTPRSRVTARPVPATSEPAGTPSITRSAAPQLPRPSDDGGLSPTP